jgi:hypothetical protein
VQEPYIQIRHRLLSSTNKSFINPRRVFCLHDFPVTSHTRTLRNHSPSHRALPKMQFTSILISLLSTLPSTLSAPACSIAHNDDPQMCGYVLTVQNSSAYAGISAYSSCTPVYYNQSIPGYQAAFAYSIFGGCRCTFHG